MPRNITKLTTNQYSFNRIYGTCVQPVLVLVNVFDKQITAAENVCPQRREVIINGNGNCFHRAVALGRDETGDNKHEIS